MTYHRQSFFSYLLIDLDERLDSLCPPFSPSETVGSPARIRELLEGTRSRIHLGRPGGAPAAIFNPALATLQQRLDGLDQVQVTRQDVEHAASYLKTAIEFYPDDSSRQMAIQEIVDVAVGQGGSWLNTWFSCADRIQPNCSWRHEEFLVMTLELKNVIGLAGNPILQAIVDYSKVVSQLKVRHPLSAHLDIMAYLSS